MKKQNTEINWNELSDICAAASGGILIVSGKSSYQASGAQNKISQLLADNAHFHFNDFTPNPTLQQVQLGCELLRQITCSLILAVGGGSALDVAKAIHLLSAYDDQDHMGILRGEIKPDQENVSGRRLVAVPTTFGTGSESTHFATIYNDEKKFSLAHSICYPDHYILDATLSASASSYIKATTGIDALCQALESYWSKRRSRESMNYALRALELISSNVVAFSSEGGGLKAAQNMAEGANLAGKAINISRTTAPHAISYGITQKYGIEHGLACALTLPYFLSQMGEELKDVFAVIGVRTGAEAAAWFDGLMSDIGLKSRLVDLVDCDDQDISYLASIVNIERLQNHPTDLTQNEIRNALLRSDLSGGVNF